MFVPSKAREINDGLDFFGDLCTCNTGDATGARAERPNRCVRTIRRTKVPSLTGIMPQILLRSARSSLIRS